MKKILFIFAFVLAIGAAKAQSNLTLVINDKVEKGYFKQESYNNWVVQGLSNATDAENFLKKIKANTNIKTASITPAANGEYTLSLAVNKIYDAKYFKRLMAGCGVKYAVVNGKQEELKPATAASK